MAATLPHPSGQEDRQDNSFGPDASQVSRARLLAELEKLGINTAALESLTLKQLADLVYGMNKVANLTNQLRGKKEHENSLAPIPLSAIDKKMLKMLFASNGSVSSVTLSKELGVPLTTVQRRRKRLATLTRSTYSLDWKKFGMRSMMFFVSIENVAPSKIGNEIMSWPEVSSVTRMFSSNRVDLMVQVVLRTNKEIMDFSERVRALAGVKEIFWNEAIEVIGQKNDIHFLNADST